MVKLLAQAQPDANAVQLGAIKDGEVNFLTQLLAATINILLMYHLSRQTAI